MAATLLVTESDGASGIFTNVFTTLITVGDAPLIQTGIPTNTIVVDLGTATDLEIERAGTAVPAIAKRQDIPSSSFSDFDDPIVSILDAALPSYTGVVFSATQQAEATGAADASSQTLSPSSLAERPTPDPTATPTSMSVSASATETASKDATASSVASGSGSMVTSATASNGTVSSAQLSGTAATSQSDMKPSSSDASSASATMSVASASASASAKSDGQSLQSSLLSWPMVAAAGIVMGMGFM